MIALCRTVCVTFVLIILGCGRGELHKNQGNEMFPPKGMTLLGDAGHRKITFSPTVTLDDMRSLITSLRERGAKLSLYDELWPSPSDPGGYFDYSQEKALPGYWSMTFGNHG